ncbi:hypothetical protein YOLOSWAG_41 [Erwinia phage vB_EamM_Yoloswag]|uniref:Uncharacterized protein n=1 Tax=Erwinia phage vB_EamM_Yoloswag TaxID=1958956 RepID=A0A1S6L2X8_9CAUD|nr:hypothetical protein HOR66_gp041 [Erwinia phage vB_EamM_Yoloswag]AQT28526.1 hypothetical protein YOLOSWAG_41 [Erwinia phage vB_EamM_Yoloswag]
MQPGQTFSFYPFKMFSAPQRDPIYTGRTNFTTHVRELPVMIGQTDVDFEFSHTERQQMDQPSLFFTAHDAAGPIEIERVAVLGLKITVLFKRQVQGFAKLRGEWQVITHYY